MTAFVCSELTFLSRRVSQTGTGVDFSTFPLESDGAIIDDIFFSWHRVSRKELEPEPYAETSFSSQSLSLSLSLDWAS